MIATPITLPRLQPGRVQVFILPSEGVPPALLEIYRSWLNPAEVERLERFRFDRHRREFLLGKALARHVLGLYTGQPPAAVSFAHNPYGRPELVGNASLRFNLSHSHGLNVLAVHGGPGELGVDVERIDAGRSDLELARRFFAPQEYRRLCHWPPERQAEGFFAYWTLKESFIKAEGRGLSLALQSFAFDLGPQGIGLELQDGLESDRQRWHSELKDLGEGFLCAWTLGSSGQRVTADYHRLVPLEELSPWLTETIACCGVQPDNSGDSPSVWLAG